MSLVREKITDDKLDIEFYENFLNETESLILYKELEKTCSWRRKLTEKSRAGQVYGDKNLVYTVTIWGKTMNRKVLHWDKLPYLLTLKDKLTKLTGQKYTVCYIQRYPSGKVGINPHRDKEMVTGTSICGISIGEKRTLSMQRIHKGINKKTDILLTNGSLYILKPPTNQYWTHCIEKDNSKNPRISLTFRNYNPEKKSKTCNFIENQIIDRLESPEIIFLDD